MSSAPANFEQVASEAATPTGLGNAAYDRSIPPYLQAAAELRSLSDGLPADVDLVGHVIRVLMGLPGIVGASHFHRSDDDRFSATTPLICRRTIVNEARRWESYLIDGVGRAVQSRQVYMSVLPDHKYRLACVPIQLQRRPAAVLCVFFDPYVAQEGMVTLLSQLAAAELAAAATSEPPANPLSEFLAAATSIPQDSARYQQLATALENLFQVAQVFVGTCAGTTAPRLEAVSGIASLTRPAPLVTLAEEVMAEAVARGELKVLETSARGDLTHSELQLCQELNATRILSGPLRDAQHLVAGAWLVVDDGRVDDAQRGMPLLDRVRSQAPLVAGVIRLIQAAHCSLQSRLMDRLRRALRSATRRHLLISALLLFAMVWVPCPHRIRCACEVQPVTRRFVPAPYDGQLQEVLVEPGDVVRVGQVLARMDKREIEWKLAAQDAEYRRASKQHDASMAAGETAAAQMAKLEMERLAVERKLLQNRLKHLEITSPVDGIILAGDPKQLEGARLTIGQTLFETGPVEQMLVELQVPESDVTLVSSARDVSVRLEALPHRRYAGTIDRISPRSEPRQGKNVFLAEFRLDNADRMLSPGMKGHGRIATGSRRLGWILFHKPLAYLSRWLP